MGPKKEPEGTGVSIEINVMLSVLVAAVVLFFLEEYPQMSPL